MKRLLLILSVLVFASASASANSLQQLQQEGKLKLRSWIEPKTQIVAGSQVDLYVEVATERWFAGGTRVGLFDVENAMVMRRVKLAHNSTRREGGKTWSVQQWQLTLYPQQAGGYQVPALPVDISVSTGIGESTDGRLFTEALTFQVDAPATMQEHDNWIAVPDLTAKQSFNHSEDTLLEVGDAVVRTVTLTAPDTASMLLPKLQIQPVSGSQPYQAQPKLSDQTTRGFFTASREDQFTYVISEPGPVVLPPITIHWWNTEKQRAETLVIPGQTFKVNGWAWRYYAEQYGLTVAAVLLGLALLWWLARRVQRLLPVREEQSTKSGRRASLRKYLAAQLRGDKLAATEQLYLKASDTEHTLRSLDTEHSWQQQLNSWFASLSEPEPEPGAVAKQETSPGVWSLWRGVSQRLKRRKQRTRWSTQALSLSINGEQEL